MHIHYHLRRLRRPTGPWRQLAAIFPGVNWRPFWGKIWNIPKIVKDQYFGAVFFLKWVSRQRQTSINHSKPDCATGLCPAPHFYFFLKKGPLWAPLAPPLGHLPPCVFLLFRHLTGLSIPSFLLLIVSWICLKNLRGAILPPPLIQKNLFRISEGLWPSIGLTKTLFRVTWVRWIHLQ